jgi:hypothetical protein
MSYREPTGKDFPINNPAWLALITQIAEMQRAGRAGVDMVNAATRRVPGGAQTVPPIFNPSPQSPVDAPEEMFRFAPPLEAGKVPLPPGFMDSLPPSSPALQLPNTGVTPRPGLSPLPEPLTRNRKGESREALKGAGIAAIIGLLLGKGNPQAALSAASGFGRGAGQAQDAAFADRQMEWQQRAAGQERDDQNRLLSWQNDEAKRQSGNEGVEAQNRLATTQYGMESDRYNRGQKAIADRQERNRRAKKDAEDLIDADLDRGLKKDELDRRKRADVEAEKYKRTPEQLEAENRAKRAMAGLAGATTIEERQYWGGVLASAEASLGYKVAPPPSRGGKLVPTATEQARINQGDKRISLQEVRDTHNRESKSVRESVAAAQKTGKTEAVLTGIQGKIYAANMRLSSMMPKTTIRMVDDGNGGKVPMPFEPTEEQMATYANAKAETERYVKFLEGQAASLKNATRQRQPDTKTFNQRMYETGAAGVSVPRGGVAPVVSKPLVGYDNSGRRVVAPPLPARTTVDANGYMVDATPAPRPTPAPRRTETKPTTRPIPASRQGRGGSDLTGLSDDELVKRMMRKK